MRWTVLPILILLLAPTIVGAETPAVALIPKPTRIDYLPGRFVLGPSTQIIVQVGSVPLEETARRFTRRIRPATGFDLHVSVHDRPQPSPNAITITTLDADPLLGEEGYELAVTSESVTIRAPSARGIFYGIQSLRQLLPPEIESFRKVDDIDWALPAARIWDRPRYKWRGLMLDCTHRFLDKVFIQRIIDLLAHCKINVLHLHLGDDDAWRFYLDRYPRVATVGSWKGESPNPNAGFYTADDIHEIVAFAHSRSVMIVPEFDIPGRCAAVTNSYPQLSCKGDGAGGWCLGNDDTIAFVRAALDQVVDCFDAPYVHLGGGRAPANSWATCPKCQARMKAENLRNERELQLWFLRQLSDYLNTKGRRVISWAPPSGKPDDLGHNAILQDRHDHAAFLAARGIDTINSENSVNRFDYPPTTRPGLPQLHLLSVYGFHPTPPPLTDTQAQHILGSEACLWTQQLGQDQIYAQLFPRLLAFAEITWSDPPARSLSEFRKRVIANESRLGRLGVRYGEVLPPATGVSSPPP